MKTLPIALLFCAAAAAQSGYISRLNADLRAGDPEHFAMDFASRFDRPVISRVFAYELTKALSGRELPENDLSRLNTAMSHAFDDAVACRRTHTDISKSQTFLDALSGVISSLKALGLDLAQVQRIASGVGRAAQKLSQYQLRIMPIPPAKEPSGPDRV